MSGLTPLVDTLLATRLAQRVDLVPLKSEVQIAGPGPVGGVEEVVNDVRLPSRAAVEQQIGVGLLKSGQRGHGGMAVRPDQAVTLSPAARAVSAILEIQTGGAARVAGSEPLLTPSQTLSPSVIAATLARTVSQSGLFYESHLAQFAAGTRSLDELTQEPQGRLQQGLKASLVMSSAPGNAMPSGLVTPEAVDLTYSRIAPPAALPSGHAAQGASGKPGGANALPVVPQADSARLAPVGDGGSDPGAQGIQKRMDATYSRIAPPAALHFSGTPQAAGSERGGANTVPVPPETDPFRLAPAVDAAQAHKNAYASVQHTEAPVSSPKNHDEMTATSARGNAPVLAGIHPDAVALVRQQLELLAQPAFRWRGEAWPEVSVEWDVQEDEQREPAAGAEASPRSWSTRLALTLPTLKSIEVRISLAGNALQVRVAAAEDTAREQLRQARTELPARLRELGFELTGLQIGLLAEPVNPLEPKADDDAWP